MYCSKLWQFDLMNCKDLDLPVWKSFEDFIQKLSDGKINLKSEYGSFTIIDRNIME